MNERMRLWMTALVLLVACGLACFGQAQVDRRASDAEFKLASSTCNSPVDSGSVKDAISRLARIAQQDPAYPKLKELQDLCQNQLKQLLNAEDFLFDQAKADYGNRKYDDARTKFQSLASKNSPRAAEANRYLSLIASAGPAAGGAAGGGLTQKDFDDLETAKRHYQMSNFDKARGLLEPLLNKGGTVGPEAKKYLDLIDARIKCTEQLQRGVTAMGQRRYSEAYQVFKAVQQQDPACPGLSTWLPQAEAAVTKAGGTVPSAAPAAPPPSANADYDRGKKLFEGQDYQGALNAFVAAQGGRGAGADLQAWIQKTEQAIRDEKRQADIDRLVKAGEKRLRNKDYQGANAQLSQALALSPDDPDIASLAEKARAGMKAAGMELRAEDKSALLAVALQQAIREFYAGNFAETVRLLQPRTEGTGKYAAVAYFYLGAARCTEYFLEGGSDPRKEAEARDFFRKGRRADPAFVPSAKWVSPKIIAVFQQAAAER